MFDNTKRYIYVNATGERRRGGGRRRRESADRVLKRRREGPIARSDEHGAARPPGRRHAPQRPAGLPRGHLFTGSALAIQ